MYDVAADGGVECAIDIGDGAHRDGAVAHLPQHRDELLERGEVRTDRADDVALDSEVWRAAAVGDVIEVRRGYRAQQLVPALRRTEDADVVVVIALRSRARNARGSPSTTSSR